MTPTERIERIGRVLRGAFEDAHYEVDNESVRAMIVLSIETVEAFAAIIDEDPRLDTTEDKDAYAMALVYLYNAAKSLSEELQKGKLS